MPSAAIIPCHLAVDRVYGFDDAPAAYAYLRGGSHFGKIVVAL